MRRPSSAPNGKSVIAGAGTGTGLIGIASALPDSYGAVKLVLMYAAPTASVVVNAAWLIMSAQLAAWWDKKRMDAALKEARRECDRVHANPNASAEHKANMQARLEKLEALKIEMLERNTAPVRAILADGGASA